MGRRTRISEAVTAPLGFIFIIPLPFYAFLLNRSPRHCKLRDLVVQPSQKGDKLQVPWLQGRTRYRVYGPVAPGDCAAGASL